MKPIAWWTAAAVACAALIGVAAVIAMSAVMDAEVLGPFDEDDDFDMADFDERLRELYPEEESA